MDSHSPSRRDYFLTAARWRSASRFALQGLSTARQRALLALIGIVVGVAAVVALVSIGKSVERQALQEFESMGTQVIHITVNQSDPFEIMLGRKARETRNTFSAQRSQQGSLLPLIQAMPEVELVSELMSAPCNAGAQSANHNETEMTAIRPAVQQILGLRMARGRFLHALDRNAMWVVLGHKIAKQMQDERIDVRPGATLSLCGKTMFVAGVLAPASTSESTIPLRIDDSLFISVAAAARLASPEQNQTLVLRVKPAVSPVAFAEQLERDLKQQTTGNVQITTSQKVIELRRRQAATYTRFLTALSSVSLFVGGLGILNIMLVAVVERRREIGIRLAIGADEVDIALQFLFESALLALAGGICGIVVGLVAALVAVWLTQLPFVFSIAGVISALLVSLLVGVSAGVYPAFQASRQDPVAALQSG